MSLVMVDIESDGPIPGDYSMICFAAMIVEPSMSLSFTGRLKPVSDNFNHDALAVSGFTREETLMFDEPEAVMSKFNNWLRKSIDSRAVFISDNNGYDWMFICWYFHHFLGHNPFGYSSVNLGSLYKGLVKDYSQNFKHLRKTEHTHDPLDDVKGNVEALLTMKNELGLKIELGRYQ